MSSISSINGGSDLYAFLQTLGSTQAGQPTSAVTASTEAAGTTAANAASANTAASTTTGGTQSTHHRHHHGHGGGGESQLFQQIQQAVTGALQGTNQTGDSNPNQTIVDAIEKVLKSNTNTPASQATANSPASTSGATSSALSSALGTSATANTAQQNFAQALKSFGVDEDQFHQDFLSALQNVQNGSAAGSTTAAGLQPGSLFDAIG